MIRALLKKQLLELCAAFVRSSKTGKRRSRVGTFGYTLLFTVLMLLVMLSFGSIGRPLAGKPGAASAALARWRCRWR